MKVLGWNAEALWCYSCRGRICTICRHYVDALCVECQGNKDSPHSQASQCNWAWDVCNHQFHFHCIFNKRSLG